MVAHLDDELGVDLVVAEVRIGRETPAAGVLGTESQAPAHGLGRREHPVKPIERALVERRIMLERRHDAGRYRRLGRAVRTVEQDETIRPPLAHEVRERSINLFLDVLLADEGTARQSPRGLLPRQFEQSIAGEVTPGMVDRYFAEVVEDVADIPARIARIANGIGVEELEKLGEREHTATGTEALLDMVG